MRLPTRIIISGFTLVGLGIVWAGLLPAEAPAREGMTLLGTLADWKYPDSNMLGASMSDGGNPHVQSVKCQAMLTTDDPFEKVVKFYSEKLGTPEAPAQPDARAAVKPADAKSVSTQDDSQGRPVAVRVIVVNRAETSTTLVISRAVGESKTHVAWSHYRRFDGKR